jgi:hypothetical protein
VLGQPSSTLGLRLGIAGDLGTSSTVDQAGFKGTWSDWGVLALASWSVSVGSLELAPLLGAGVERVQLDGEIGMAPRTEAATLPVLRAGVTVRWPLGRWSVGASLSADLVVDTPTYTKDVGMGMGSKPTVFEVPGFAALLGVFAAADLGR